MSVLLRIRAKNEMRVYELPYMESVMCECLLASGRALVTPTVVWSAKNRVSKRVPDPPHHPLGGTFHIRQGHSKGCEQCSNRVGVGGEQERF